MKKVRTLVEEALHQLDDKSFYRRWIQQKGTHAQEILDDFQEVRRFSTLKKHILSSA